MTNDLALEAFPDFCHEHGLKCTAQRHAVFATLRQAHDHPSVDEIWGAVRNTIPTVTRDSVYRILNEFSALGLISRMDALSAARYDTCLGPHAHFICERCGSVTDFPLPPKFPVPKGMPTEQHHFELRVTGVCDRCRKAE